MAQEERECGPDVVSWFGRGQWPRCTCGFSPRDNTKLNEHWNEAGFRVIDNHGKLEVWPLWKPDRPA